MEKIKCLLGYHKHEWSEFYLIKLSKHNWWYDRKCKTCGKWYFTSAIVIANMDKKVEFKDTLECTEAMAIGRSVSYLKQHLPEEKSVDIFSDKLSREQVDELEYLKRTNFNFTINDESHKDRALEKMCEQTLNERFEFGNYKAMKRFNSNQQNGIKTDSEPRTQTLDELHKACHEYMKNQFDNYNYD